MYMYLDLSVQLITSDPVSPEGKDGEPIHLHTTIKEPVLLSVNWWTALGSSITILWIQKVTVCVLYGWL